MIVSSLIISIVTAEKDEHYISVTLLEVYIMKTDRICTNTNEIIIIHVVISHDAWKKAHREQINALKKDVCVLM